MNGVSGFRSGLSTVTRGTLFLIVSTLCLVLFNFGTRVLMIRSLSQVDWGYFSVGFTLALLLSSVGTLGLPSAVARSLPYASNDDQRRAIVRFSLTVGIASAVLLSVALVLIAPWIGAALHASAIGVGLTFFSIAIGSAILATILAAIFQGYADVTPNAVFIQVVNPALFLVALVVARELPAFGLTYRTALLGYALANVVALGAIAVYALRRLPERLPAGPRDPEAGPRLLRFAAPLFVVGAMASLAGSGDTLVLGIYHLGQVATYSASLTLAKLLQIGLGAAAYIFLPVAARFHRDQDRRSIRLTYATVTKWMVLFSLPLFLLFVFLSRASLAFVYTSAYSAVLLPLQIAVFGAFLVTILGPAATTQLAYGQVRALAINSAIAGVADVVIALLLVPRFGSAGAATAWAASNLLYSGLCLAGLIWADGVHPFGRAFVVPLLGTSIPVGIALFVLSPIVPRWALIPIGLAIAGAFVVVVVLTGSIDDGDRLLLGVIEGLLGRQVPFVRRFGRWASRVTGR